jgi:hypothetical protein
MDTELLASATTFTFTPSGTDRADMNTRHFRFKVEWRGGDNWLSRTGSGCGTAQIGKTSRPTPTRTTGSARGPGLPASRPATWRSS